MHSQRLLMVSLATFLSSLRCYSLSRTHVLPSVPTSVQADRHIKTLKTSSQSKTLKAASRPLSAPRVAPSRRQGQVRRPSPLQHDVQRQKPARSPRTRRSRAWPRASTERSASSPTKSTRERPFANGMMQRDHPQRQRRPLPPRLPLPRQRQRLQTVH